MFENQPGNEVEALLESDSEFRKLFRRHQELDKQVLDDLIGRDEPEIALFVGVKGLPIGPIRTAAEVLR